MEKVFRKYLALSISILLLIPVYGFAKTKTYKHASEYQIGMLEMTIRKEFSNVETIAKTVTDRNLSSGNTLGFYILYTDAGFYRVQSPINKGLTYLSIVDSALDKKQSKNAKTYINKWFLDNVESGTNVVFAAECNKPNKKHPNDMVKCRFWFPDPDSTYHEYATIGDFTPFILGDGSNTKNTANVLCGTGTLKPEVEAQLCGTY